MKKDEREAFEKKYGKDKLRKVDLPLDDFDNDFLEVIIKVPDRATLSQYMKYSDINPKKAQDILIKQCLLTNKEQVMSDDALYLTCVSAIAELIPIREYRLKKF